ncbi:hypothetical protein H8957_013938 [Semnopithecus entellus]
MRDPIPLQSPKAGTAPAPARPGPHARTRGGASGRAGDWWPGPITPPGTCLGGGGAGEIGRTQRSRGGVTRPGRAARPHDVNPQGSALLCRLPRVAAATAAGRASVAWPRPSMQMSDVTRTQWPTGATATGSAPPGELAPAAAAPEAPVYANLSSYAGGAGGAGGAGTVAFAAEPVPFPPPPPPGALGPPRLAALKDEPQTVPDVPSFGESPPLSPIDMDTQERIKAERKRLRNRIAASKCRKRKLERISRLEEKVKTLKSQNTELASTASLLREQVAQLKQKVLSHVNSGCQLLPQHQVPAY